MFIKFGYENLYVWIVYVGIWDCICSAWRWGGIFLYGFFSFIIVVEVRRNRSILELEREVFYSVMFLLFFFSDKV